MMGLQATAGKRKLEGGVGCMEFDMDMGESPSKLGRVEGSWWAMEDSYTPPLNQSSSYYEMEVSSPCLQGNPCQPTGNLPPAGPQLHHPPQHYYHQRSSPPGGNGGYNQLSRPQPQWGAPHHYEPPTIRREENGKSYLELGSSYRANERCCEGSRTSWCRRGRACYRQRRLAVLNISMCKLARYRQFPDPSLHRSVLICNTLRHLEREMERDRSPPPMEPVIPAPMAQLQHPEQGRLTPFPIPPTASNETDVDSGIGDSDDSRSINWGSVLSLSSQSPLDPLNNNELLDVDIGPEIDLDFMPGWKLTPLSADDILRSTNVQDHHLNTTNNISSTINNNNNNHIITSNNSCNSSSTHESLMCPPILASLSHLIDFYPLSPQGK
ncbi:GSCOCG00003759001-RA-CDS [Cotesia congregata]|nr:GSCOCG00003759001-RA-CDS [Cotesia congregata]